MILLISSISFWISTSVISTVIFAFSQNPSGDNFSDLYNLHCSSKLLKLFFSCVNRLLNSSLFFFKSASNCKYPFINSSTVIWFWLSTSKIWNNFWAKVWSNWPCFECLFKKKRISFWDKSFWLSHPSSSKAFINISIFIRLSSLNFELVSEAMLMFPLCINYIWFNFYF